jgi:hypothetical protein
MGMKFVDSTVTVGALSGRFVACYSGPMAMLNLTRSPDVVEAIAIIDDGNKVTLVQKTLGNGGASQCLFFEKFLCGEFEIQLRLDWNQLDEHGGPTLDADVYKIICRVP